MALLWLLVIFPTASVIVACIYIRLSHPSPPSQKRDSHAYDDWHKMERRRKLRQLQGLPDDD